MSKKALFDGENLAFIAIEILLGMGWLGNLIASHGWWKIPAVAFFAVLAFIAALAHSRGALNPWLDKGSKKE